MNIPEDINGFAEESVQIFFQIFGKFLRNGFLAKNLAGILIENTWAIGDYSFVGTDRILKEFFEILETEKLLA